MRFEPELKLCDPATDRVVRTVWEVKAIDGSRESMKRAALPRRTELWFTNE